MPQLSAIEQAFVEEPYLSFETTPFYEQVWDPTSSIPGLPGLDDDPIEEDYLVELLKGGLSVLQSLDQPVLAPTKMETIRGMEVGDDRIDISNGTFCLGLAIFCQSKVARFETSWKDTAISQRVWNFCEVTSVVPSTILGNIQRAKKKGFNELEYVDSPPLRIIIDVQKGDRSHSSSGTGKAQMLGTRMRSVRTGIGAVLHASSWIQDSTLNTTGTPDPKYLPQVVGGSGCPPLWGAWQNTHLFIKAYKNGSYERIYGSAVNELRECVQALERGERTQPVLCAKLRSRQEYLHITYASNILIPRQGIKVGLDLEDIEPLYRALGGTALCQGVENRLVQAGKLLTQTKASAEIDITDGILKALFSNFPIGVTRHEKETISRRARAEFDEALRGNSAVQRLLLRKAAHHDLLELAGGKFLTAGSGVQSMNSYLSEWISLGGKGEAFTIEDLIFSEDMYVFDEVSLARSMRVAHIPLTPIFLNKEVIENRTRSDIGLWQMTASKLEWAERITDQLINLRSTVKDPGYQNVFPIFYENREWVNDDSLLIRKCADIAKSKTKVSVILLSSDARLGKRMARTTGLPIARVDPIEVIINNPTLDYHSKTVFTPQQVLGTDKEGNDLLVDYPPVFDEVLVDTGSLEACAQKFTRREFVPGQGQEVRHITLHRSGFTESGARYEVQRVQSIPGTRVVKIYMHLANDLNRTTHPRRSTDAGPPPTLSQRAKAGMRRFAKRF
jgi:hypothetical protein